MQDRLLQDRHVKKVSVHAKRPAVAWAVMAACRARRLACRRSRARMKGPTAAGTLRASGRGLHPPQTVHMGSGALAQAPPCATQGLDEPWGLAGGSVVRA